MRQLSALDRLFLTQENARTPAHLSALLFYSQQTETAWVFVREAGA